MAEKEKPLRKWLKPEEAKRRIEKMSAPKQKSHMERVRARYGASG